MVACYSELYEEGSRAYQWSHPVTPNPNSIDMRVNSTPEKRPKMTDPRGVFIAFMGNAHFRNLRKLITNPFMLQILAHFVRKLGQTPRRPS